MYEQLVESTFMSWEISLDSPSPMILRSMITSIFVEPPSRLNQIPPKQKVGEPTLDSSSPKNDLSSPLNSMYMKSIYVEIISSKG